VLLKLTGKGLVVGNELKLWFIDVSVEAEEGKRCEASVRVCSKFLLGGDDSYPSDLAGLNT
jgi:hypothetical protein